MTDTKIQAIEDKYDEFFGDGYWEKEYKEQIVIFATQCLEQFGQSSLPVHGEKETKSEVSSHSEDKNELSFFCEYWDVDKCDRQCKHCSRIEQTEISKKPVQGEKSKEEESEWIKFARTFFREGGDFCNHNKKKP